MVRDIARASYALLRIFRLESSAASSSSSSSKFALDSLLLPQVSLGKSQHKNCRRKEKRCWLYLVDTEREKGGRGEESKSGVFNIAAGGGGGVGSFFFFSKMGFCHA